MLSAAKLEKNQNNIIEYRKVEEVKIFREKRSNKVRYIRMQQSRSEML